MDTELFLQAKEYCNHKGLRVVKKDRIGFGTDGSVWRSNRETAVKACYREDNYRNEIKCYEIFKNRGISKINGLSIPILEGSDSEGRVIEMTIVEPPYLLDFGKVYVDEPPPYRLYEMPSWHEKIREEFEGNACLLYTSPSPRDRQKSRMPSSA